MDKVIIKGIVVGNASVGKTWMLEKLRDKERSYFTTNPTLGVDFFSFDEVRDEKIYRLQLWDTSGDIKFENLIRSYFSNVAYCFVCFSLKDKIGLDKINEWIELAKIHCPSDVKIILVGTKANEQNISEEFLKEKLEDIPYDFYKVGKDYDSVFKPISYVVDDVIDNIIIKNEHRTGVKIIGSKDEEIEDHEHAGFGCLPKIFRDFFSYFK